MAGHDFVAHQPQRLLAEDAEDVAVQDSLLRSVEASHAGVALYERADTSALREHAIFVEVASVEVEALQRGHHLPVLGTVDAAELDDVQCHAVEGHHLVGTLLAAHTDEVVAYQHALAVVAGVGSYNQRLHLLDVQCLTVFGGLQEDVLHTVTVGAILADGGDAVLLLHLHQGTLGDAGPFKFGILVHQVLVGQVADGVHAKLQLLAFSHRLHEY